MPIDKSLDEGNLPTEKSLRPFSLSNPMIVDGVFYIPSDALLPGINKIVLKDNELFAILDETGESPRIYERELGFYFRDTRYLDTWELNINGSAATALSCDAHTKSNSYAFVMTNKDTSPFDQGPRIRRDRLKIERIISLDADQVIEQLEIKNYDSETHRLEIERRAASRFNDIFEVRGMRRARRGTIHPPFVSTDKRTVTLSYDGVDDKRYTTAIWLSAPADQLKSDDGGVILTHNITLAPRAATTLKYVISFDRQPSPMFRGVSLADLAVNEHMTIITSPPENTSTSSSAMACHTKGISIPNITTDNEEINRMLAVASTDLAALMTHRHGSAYPDAGIPWFCAPFGRDGLITAYQMLPWCPQVAEGVLDLVFSMLGKAHNPTTDEEPGKVFHENRFGEMARLREIPFTPYYGSVDSTPLSLILLGEYLKWTQNTERVLGWWEQAKAAVNWIRRSLAESPLGLLTYKAATDRGLRNQGWKDSDDSVMHIDGSLANAPIALCEAQAYAYRALVSMAEIAQRVGQTNESSLWAEEAAALQQRFGQWFWNGDRQMVHLAIDSDRRPCQVLSSNMGHCLFGGILSDQQAERVAEHLLGSALFSGHGIRTLASTETSYNPLSYHNGSVWPHDNSLAAEGLRAYGYCRPLLKLADALFHVATAASDHRLPELFCGFPRYGDAAPVPYDVACKPQAWAAGTPYLVLKALLGMNFCSASNSLVFRAPHLPKQISALTINGLRVADFEVDLLVRRGTLVSTVEVLRTSAGPGRVVVIK